MNRQLMRSAWVEFLTGLPTKYLLTIVFPFNTREVETKHLLNMLIRHLNRRIYKRRYKDKKSYLEGVVVREFTYGNTDHYHLLLTDPKDSLPDIYRLKAIVQMQTEYIKKQGGRNYIREFQLEEYYNNGKNKLEQYLTKDMTRYQGSLENIADSIGLLSDGDVLFGSNKFVHY